MLRPAFSSTRSAAAFALLLLLLLLLPVLLTKSILPPREQVYAWSGWDTTGPHPYQHQVIYEEKGDIDIAFLGSSRLWHGINTPHVQDLLTEKLGRPAVVRTIGWGGAGFDELYFITKDLLQNRKVKMIVFYDEHPPIDQANSLAPNSFRFADDAGTLTALPWRLKLSYYYAAILGAPKNLLSLLRSCLPADMSPAKMNSVQQFYHSEDIVKQLGATTVYLGYNYSTLFEDFGPFIPYMPLNHVAPSDVDVYSPETPSPFQFSGPPVPDWQLQFARKFAELAQQNNVKLVLLHIPKGNDLRSTVINEREFWPDALHADISMVGVPAATLFDGLSDDDARKLFTSFEHLNKNGQEFYTWLITPALLKLYAPQTNH